MVYCYWLITLLVQRLRLLLLCMMLVKDLDLLRVATGIRGDGPKEWAEDNGWNYELTTTYDKEVGPGIATQPLINENHFLNTIDTHRLDSNGNLIYLFVRIAQGQVTLPYL